MEELAQVVAGVMLRRTKDEALDLPPKMRTWQPVEIDSAEVRRAEATALRSSTTTPSATVPPGPRSWAARTRLATPSPRQGSGHSGVRCRALEADEKAASSRSASVTVEPFDGELDDPVSGVMVARP